MLDPDLTEIPRPFLASPDELVNAHPVAPEFIAGEPALPHPFQPSGAAAPVQVPPKAGKGVKRLTLSNGAVATVRQPRGLDLVRAQQLARDGDNVAVGLALVSRCTHVGEGRRVTMDDLYEMPLSDVQALLLATQEDAEGFQDPVTSSD